MQAVSINYRAYALDLWGFGDTARYPGGYSLEQQVNLLDSFLQEMGIGKIALIGHDLGGIVALLFAIRHSRLVDRLMIVSLPGDPQSIHPRLRSATLNDLADWLFGRDPESESVKAEALKIDPQAIQLTLVEAQSLLADQWIHELTIPCLMVHGLSDPLINPSSQDLFGPMSQYIHQIIFEQSGHYPMLDEPAKFNRLIADFLALPSGTSPNQLQIKEEWKRRIR